MEGVYHCISRCVRQAFLCGSDQYSGRSYEHRREWIRTRLEELSHVFAIEISAYAVMSNHLHVVLRTRPDWIDEWSDEEIALRWLAVFNAGFSNADLKDDIKNKLLQALLKNKPRLKEIRSRLSSVSWFMRCTNEFIARKANREDGCRGRFWEGRFKCLALLDKSADLACMIYVDLNPIRAKIAETPEESEFTSAYERIAAIKQNSQVDQTDASFSPGSWLCPIGNESSEKQRGILSLSLSEYLDLLDWTGRQIIQGKRGAIPDNLEPILERFKINQDKWVNTVQGFGRMFKRAAGGVQSMTDAASRMGLRRLWGFRAGRDAFSMN